MDFFPIASKPIFVAYVPLSLFTERADEIQRDMRDSLPDYHTIICPTENNAAHFEAFYAKDLIATDFERFKEMIYNRFEHIERQHWVDVEPEPAIVPTAMPPDVNNAELGLDSESSMFGAFYR